MLKRYAIGWFLTLVSGAVGWTHMKDRGLFDELSKFWLPATLAVLIIATGVIILKAGWSPEARMIVALVPWSIVLLAGPQHIDEFVDLPWAELGADLGILGAALAGVVVLALVTLTDIGSTTSRSKPDQRLDHLAAVLDDSDSSAVTA